MGPDGTAEEIDFKVPIVLLDMTEYPPFRSVKAEEREEDSGDFWSLY
jgi:hypothetical protein